MLRIALTTLLAGSCWAGMTFVHPGALDAKAELDFDPAIAESVREPLPRAERELERR